MTEALWFLLGVMAGAAAMWVMMVVLTRVRRGDRDALVERLQAQLGQEVGAIAETLKTHFAALSREALSRNADDFLKLAGTKLDQQTAAGTQQFEQRRKLIAAALDNMNAKLTELVNITQTLDKDRRETAGAIKAELAKTTEATGKLRETATRLREVLASPKARGQWGERMAEDILGVLGMVEGVNYVKQATLDTGSRPDFTFILPRGMKLHMDVKFPLDNYVRAAEADDPDAAASFEAAFLKDVRNRVSEITDRDYIESEDTVDCMLVLIPNEQIHQFIHEHDPTLLDDALRQKIILCSPMTLYAVLAVVRQAADQFRLERISNDVLRLLGSFRSEWSRYCEVVDKLGRALDAALRCFQTLQTTRTRKLERHLDRIEVLQSAEDGSESASVLPSADAPDRS